MFGRNRRSFGGLETDNEVVRRLDEAQRGYISVEQNETKEIPDYLMRGIHKIRGNSKKDEEVVRDLREEIFRTLREAKRYVNEGNGFRAECMIEYADQLYNIRGGENKVLYDSKRNETTLKQMIEDTKIMVDQNILKYDQSRKTVH